MMTQSAFAEHVGLGPACISMIECGRSNPTLEVMLVEVIE
jgi:DNA-binding XRE family transcriptional regulator